MRIPRTIARSVMLLLGIAALAGCASLDDDLPAHKPPEGRSGLAMSPLPDHSAALRCMDDLLLDYGTRELAVAADELADPARKTAGYRYLLLSAASDMSKRSRAIRVVAQGTEAGGSRSLKPQFMLRGSISRAQDRTMGLDLMAVTVQDGTVAGGVTNRKFRSDAADELVLRSLVEAASIEVFGRLAKVPYWTCLGQRSDDPAVSAEIGDWYDAMAARPKEIIEYFQTQLGLRGAYVGPVDGAVNSELNDAVARYREALGLSREPRLTKDFMQAFLAADHRAVRTRLAPAASKPVTPPPATLAAPAPPSGLPAAPPAPPAGAPLALRVGAADGARAFGGGELVRLDIKPSRDAHVYCFLQDESRKISRFFPNRFQRDSRVAAGTGLQLPGAMRFEIRMNSKGVKETVACFATEQDVLPALPPALAADDFAPLPVASLDELRGALGRAARGVVAHEAFEVRPK